MKSMRFLRCMKKTALKAAKLQVHTKKRADTPELLGVPIALKNNILMKGKKATAAF